MGLAPNKEEVAADRPFIDGAGKLLWSVAQKGGWSRADVYILNVIGENGAAADSNPTKDQYEKYWDAFNDNLASFRGRFIVALGGQAFWRVTGIKGGIDSWRGYIVHPNECEPLERRRILHTVYKTSNKARGITKGDPRLVKEKVYEVSTVRAEQTIFPCLQPASVLKSGFSNLPAFSADIRRVGRALRGELDAGRLVFGTSTITQHDAFGPCVFDIETKPSLSGHDVVERVGVGTTAGTWTDHWSDATRTRLAGEFARANVSIAHNIAFDAPRLARLGLPPPEPWFDTMLAANMLQPDLYMGLNAVASLYLDRQRWKHLNEDNPEFYNAQDVNATWDLYHALREALERDGQLAHFENVVMRTVPTLVEMTQRGIRMDTTRRDEWLEELRNEESQLGRTWHTHTGGIDLRSHVKLGRYLYDDLALPRQYNKYGGTTTDIGAIETLIASPAGQDAKIRSMLQCLKALRDVSKLRSTYATHPLGDDQCIHPSYLPSRKDNDSGFGRGLAGTGRITSRDPNIQNQPQSARRLYTAHSPDEILIEVDYSQIELRIAAALSNDPALLAALATGDVHAVTMQRMGIDRTRAKGITYGSLYGAGVRKLAQVLRQEGYDVTEKECKEMQDGFKRAYPDLWMWRERVVQDVAKNYFVTNPFGRRRYFFRGAGDAPGAINFLPQSSVSDILWTIIRQLSDGLREVRGSVLTTVHDSLLFEIPRDQTTKAVGIIRTIMGQEWPMIAPGFRVPIEIKRGDNWGEMLKI